MIRNGEIISDTLEYEGREDCLAEKKRLIRAFLLKNAPKVNRFRDAVQFSQPQSVNFPHKKIKPYIAVCVIRIFIL